MAIWSGDVGRSGHTMREHILQLDRLLAELPRIDVVVMLVGANDLTGRLRQGYSYAPPAPLDDPAVRAARFRQAFTRVPGRLHDRATALQSEDVPRVKRTALFQLAKLARDRWVEARGGTRQDRFGEAYVTWRRHRAQAPQVLDSLPDLTEPLGEYRGLLENAVEIAAARRVRLVLLTQPALWRADLTPAEHRMLWLGGLGDFQERPGQGYFSARTLREGLDAYNATLLDVCLGHSAECVDMASLLVATTTNFYDDVHFTERGSAELARHLAGYLGARPPFAPDASAAVR
jgi:lysophospholipase L1-like esterase